MSSGLGRNDALAAALEALAGAVREQEHQEKQAAPTPVPAPVILPWNVLLWREDLVPPETLLTVEQVAEATGWSKAAIYKRTSKWHREHSATEPLPHQHVDRSLRFQVGALRRWVREHAQVIVVGTAFVVSERCRRDRTA